ncbi:MAG: hypothetical protein HY810_06395 [Candidatus Omnitrophica bacterium]|nr:hypothetical protein [Candidatus Omnitrophota bacterium]
MAINKEKYRNFILKIFSLILAIIIWFYIHSIVQNLAGGPVAYKDVKDVEVKLMGEQLFLGKNIFLVELEEKSIDLRIKGPERVVEKISNIDITAYVNVSGLRAGRTYSPVVNFILPENIELIGAAPVARVEIKEKSL